MSVSINKNSMLRMFTLNSIDGIELWAVDALPVFDADTTDGVVTYKEYDAVDVLAYQNYRDEVLWWGVSLLNQFWNSLRAFEKYLITWTDDRGRENKVVVYGDEMATERVNGLVDSGIPSDVIIKERVFDLVRIASPKRLFGLI